MELCYENRSTIEKETWQYMKIREITNAAFTN